MASLMQLPPALATGEAESAGAGPGAAVGRGEDEEEEGGGGRGGRGTDDDGGAACCERGGDVERGRVLEGVLSALPTFSRRYSLGSEGLYASYVNDELGSALRHSESPNCQASLYVLVVLVWLWLWYILMMMVLGVVAVVVVAGAFCVVPVGDFVPLTRGVHADMTRKKNGDTHTNPFEVGADRETFVLSSRVLCERGEAEEQARMAAHRAVERQELKKKKNGNWFMAPS